MPKKRFRLFQISEQILIGKAETLKELFEKFKHLGPDDDYFVDDTQENDEANFQDIYNAFTDGELPEDLSFF